MKLVRHIGYRSGDGLLQVRFPVLEQDDLFNIITKKLTLRDHYMNRARIRKG